MDCVECFRWYVDGQFFLTILYFYFQEFATELQSGCVSNSSLPDDFAIHTMNVVKMEIFNKLR